MDILKELITPLSPLFKQAGFKKEGKNYYLEKNKNYGIINFQKSRSSTKEIISFTINFGVYSGVLGKSLSGDSDDFKPKFGHCHWHARVGSFMHNQSDYWWKVSWSDDLTKIRSNLEEVIQNIIMPEISKRISNDGLIHSWMNEPYAGTTEIGKFRYLTTLLKAKGDFIAFNQVVETFMQKTMGKETKSLAIQHLKEL